MSTRGTARDHSGPFATGLYFPKIQRKGSRLHGWGVFAVEDINKNNDWGEYWWQLQTCPENVVTTYKNSATIRGWRHGNLLDVHFAIPPKDAYLRPHTLTVEQDISTTSSYKYIRDIPAHVDRFERRADAGWRIAQRRCVWDWANTLPMDVKHAFGESYTLGRRDREDPSYEREEGA